MAGLVARGHEVDAAGVDAEVGDGFDDVDDGRAGADADVAERGVEMVGDGADGGVAFGGFDVGHWGGLGVEEIAEMGSAELGRCGLGCVSVGSLLVSMGVLVEAQKAGGFLQCGGRNTESPPKHSCANGRIGAAIIESGRD